ncbi:MAG: KilA-N domain-containing protein [Rhizobiaceae bacterium]|nr:KilA-N domain-containing protein [Rhizobiaceae bacterium]
MPEMKVMLFKKTRIRVDEHGLVCLNDIHKAAGFTTKQRPSDWSALPNTLKSIAVMLARITGKSGNWTKSEYRSVLYTKTGQSGGTWAHENLALSFAEFLSPALGIEIRDVFLRYQRGDETLIPEILSRKPASSDRDLHRQIGKGVRKEYTAALDAHGVKLPVEYALCTNETYKALLGGTAKQIRIARGLPDRANIRDNMSLRELAYTMASEALATEQIEHRQVTGFLECQDATKRAGEAIRGAIENERKATPTIGRKTA